MNTDLITMEQIRKNAGNKPFYMVVIYADWCRHCQDMIAEINKLSNNQKALDIQRLVFYEQNDVVPELQEYFPKIIIFRYGRQFDGTKEDLYNFIQGK
jgi:thiol-disulfide isomerase/thioredoxin